MKTVLITGGSSGIGFEISKRFAQDGYHILWVSLLEDEIQAAKAMLQTQIPDVQIDSLAIDLSQLDAPQAVYDWVQQNAWTLNVLINNAGFATYGMTPTIELAREVNMIQLNVLGVFQLTRLFLPDMLERDAGTIINISSSTSFQPVPRMAAYAATKAFVAHYSQALHMELQELKSKVRVMTVCPAGIKDTKFKVAASMERVKTFEGLTATTKNEVADDIWRAFTQKKDFLKTGAKLRNTYWLTKILPKPILYALMRQELSEE